MQVTPVLPMANAHVKNVPEERHGRLRRSVRRRHTTMREPILGAIRGSSPTRGSWHASGAAGRSSSGVLTRTSPRRRPGRSLTDV
jgi:hypothetical protein